MTAAGLAVAAVAVVLLVMREITRRTPPALVVGVALATFAVLAVLRVVALAS